MAIEVGYMERWNEIAKKYNILVTDFPPVEFTKGMTTMEEIAWLYGRLRDTQVAVCELCNLISELFPQEKEEGSGDRHRYLEYLPAGVLRLLKADESDVLTIEAQIPALYRLDRENNILDMNCTGYNLLGEIGEQTATVSTITLVGENVGNNSEIFNSYTGATKNTATGYYSTTTGSENTNSGNHQFVGGHAVNSDAPYSFVYGDGVTVESSSGQNLVFGNNINISAGMGACVLGRVISSDDNDELAPVGYSTFIMGEAITIDHECSNNYSFICGSQHDFGGNYCDFVSGYSNTVLYGVNYATVMGEFNTLGNENDDTNNCTGSFIAGANNNLNGLYSSTIGGSNTVYATNSAAFGNTNTIPNGSDDGGWRYILGYNNNLKYTRSVVVGDSNTACTELSATVGYGNSSGLNDLMTGYISRAITVGVNNINRADDCGMYGQGLKSNSANDDTQFYGQFNEEEITGNYAVVVGAGSSTTRKTAVKIDRTGVVHCDTAYTNSGFSSIHTVKDALDYLLTLLPQQVSQLSETLQGTPPQQGEWEEVE